MVDNLQDLTQAVNPLSMKLGEYPILTVESDLKFGDLNSGGTKVVTVPPVRESVALFPLCPVAKILQAVSLGADIEDKDPPGRES